MRLISFITFVAVLPLLSGCQNTEVTTDKKIESTAEQGSIEFSPRRTHARSNTPTR